MALLQVNLTMYQAIVTRSAIIEGLPGYREYLESAPGSMRGVIGGHVEAMEEALVELNRVLSDVGVSPEKEEVVS